MRIKVAIPDHLVTPEILEAALGATMLADEQAMIRGEIPDVRDAIRAGIKWKPEPYTDGEHFDLGHEVMRRKWGDCDDLAPWLGASLRASGEDPDARPRVYQSGPKRWHVVTETGDGEILDPSKWAGMGKRSSPNNPGVSGAVARPFALPLHGALGVMPHRGFWLARADVPFADGGAHLASHGYGQTPEDALNVAVSGALCCGDNVWDHSIDRLCDAGSFLLSDAGVCGDDFEIAGNVGRDLNSVANRALAARGMLKKMKGGQVPPPDSEIWTNDNLASQFFGKMVPKSSQHTVLAFYGKQTGLGKMLEPLKKPFEKAVYKISNEVVPGSGSVLQSLTSAARSGKASRVGPSTKRSHKSASIHTPHGSDPHTPMTLYYHPAGAIGPVVVRF